MVLTAPPEQRLGSPGDRGSAPLPTVIVPADIRPPWRVVFGALLIGVLCTLLGAQGAYFAESARTEVWEAAFEVEFRDPNLLPETVSTTFESPSIWGAVAAREGYSDKDFREWYNAEVARGTQIVRISFGDPDAERAKRVVNGVVDSYFSRFNISRDADVSLTDEVAVDQLAEIDKRLDELIDLENTLRNNLEIEGISRELQIDYGNALIRNQQQQTNLSLAKTRVYDDAQKRQSTLARPISPEAYVEEEPLQPAPLKAAVFGAGAGGLVGLVAVYLTLHRSAMPQTPAVDTSAPTSTPSPGRRLAPVGGTVSRAAKRLTDLVGSLLLIVVLSPFLLVLTLAVRLSSRGPAFFRQERVGRNGELFQILKFRTMTVNNDDSEHRAYIEAMLAEADGAAEKEASDEVHKLNDSRVTGVGGFLRRLSLDELPQLWNVLKGDMSLIGPRPALPWEHDLFTPEQQERVRAVPGCSGLWQTSGRNKLTMSEMLDLDIQYIERWSFWGDLGILLRTPFAILRGDGAR